MRKSLQWLSFLALFNKLKTSSLTDLALWQPKKTPKPTFLRHIYLSNVETLSNQLQVIVRTKCHRRIDGQIDRWWQYLEGQLINAGAELYKVPVLRTLYGGRKEQTGNTAVFVMAICTQLRPNSHTSAPKYGRYSPKYGRSDRGERPSANCW